MKSQWHQEEATVVLAGLDTQAGAGLDAQEAAQRLAQHGPNELVERGGRSPWRILWEQFTATMVLILLAAVIVSAILGKWQEAVAILAVVVLFGLLGFFQEYRAERAMAALRRLSVPTVRVRRNGSLHEFSARDIVPGDIVLLEAGNAVPADLRLLEAVNLRIQEAALTGEAEAIEKETGIMPAGELSLGDRRNMAYLGTVVTYGRGAGVVVATGMHTELGNIAELLQGVVTEQTPLQRRLDQVGKILAIAGVLVAILVGVIGVLRGEAIIDMFLVGVSIAVAVVPEGLPAVVTITLALGARRMLARNALIRKLPAVETLGSVTVICSDKTGTLTENRMTVTVLDVAGHRINLTEELTDAGQARFDTHQAQTAPNQAINLLLIGGALCNDAQLQRDDASGHYHALGDPTEGALVVAAARLGMQKQELDQAMPRLAELPFDSERKRMTTVHQHAPALPLPVPIMPGQRIAFTKGAVDGLLDIAGHVWDDDRRFALDATYRARIEAANRGLAENGMRVLGVAFRILDENEPVAETGLTIVGFVGIIDPPRPEVKAAVATARTAGIRPVMITGDHPLTALHIARELGIATAQSKVLTGGELERMTEAELDAAVGATTVYARVSPEHKLRIVASLQRQGEVVAMTGDGVNDAPALKQADIGVAMGITGTDVSKEAADMVLRDDNFSTIVAAVEEGRVIYDNLRKFIKFSIGGNIGKVIVMLGGVLAGLAAPLLPLQLLWLNLLTDGLLGIGLGVEPGERGVMRRPPVSPQAGIFSGGIGGQIVRMGILIGALALGTGLYHYWTGHADWQTIMFTTLAFAQVWQAIAVRSNTQSIFRIGFFSNPILLLLVVAVVALQLAAIYVPFLQQFLGTTTLAWNDLALCFGVGVLVLVLAEIEKWWAHKTDTSTMVGEISVA